MECIAIRMDTFRRDVVYAFRVLVARPGFTIVAALTLAIGIGANSTIFTLINGVLLRPMPYPRSERLLNVWTSYPASKGQPDIFSPPNYLDLAARAKTMESGAYTQASYTLAGSGESESEYVPGIRMTASLGSVLGVQPRRGRWFTAQEDDGAQNMVVLSDSLWRGRYGADEKIVGRTLQINGNAAVVVGVLPPAIGFPTLQIQIYTPISFTAAARAEASRGNVFINVVSRLRDGATLQQAEAELRTLAASMAGASTLNAGIQMGATSLQDSIVGNVRSMLLALWIAVAFMLAVGCANIANLLLAHAASRRREFALRRSLGATSARLVRQLLTESVMLAGLGGALGLLLEAWMLPVIASHLPNTFPHVRELAVDAQVLWFTLAVSLVTGVAFGLAPAFGSVRAGLAESLRESERGGRSVGQRRMGSLLVVGEVAAVLVLLVGAGLVLRSLSRLSRLDPGFRTNGVIAWQLFLPSTRYPNADAQRAFYDRVTQQVESLPGVEAVGLAQPMPFGPLLLVADSGFRIAGQPDPAPDQMPQGLVTRASTGYFSAMGIPVLRGRVFAKQDDQTSQVVVISDALRRVYFPSVDPLGQTMLLGSKRLPMQIIGVVGDVKHNNLRNDIRPEFYLPMSRFTTGAAGLVVRSNAGNATMLPALQQRVWAIDNALAGNLASPVDVLLAKSLDTDRVTTVLLGVFAGATLLLGLIGVYGVLSYSVRQRTREIGIRVALGATPRVLLRMVFGEALTLAAAGVGAGLIAALAVSRYLASLLFGVTPLDPLTYAVAAIAVPCAALIAACIPAIRATKVDPAELLRAE